MKLFCDDIRKCPDGWELARTNTKAIRILATMSVEEISIDHDICCQMERVSGQGFSTHSSNETFMPIVYYILAMPRESRPKVIYIHTANTPAGDLMMEMLKGQVDYLKRDWSFGESQMNRKDFENWEIERKKYE